MRNIFKVYLVLICLIIFSKFAIGQSILKKKEIQLKLEIITKEIDKKNFENAMNIFFSKTEVIKKESVPKKMIEKYNLIENTLRQTKVKFDKTKTEVETYKQYFESNEYCKSIGLLNFILTNENSYKETQQIFTELEHKLLKAKEICEINTAKLIKWENEFKTNNFEQIYHILGINNYDKFYYYATDIENLEKLQHKLKPKYSIYKGVKDIIISNPEKIIDNIDFNTLTFEQSQKLINDLNNINNNSKDEIKKLEGNNPVLIKNYNDITLKIKIIINKLHEFSVANKPFSEKELEMFLTDNSIKLSIETIFKCFNEIENSLFPSSFGTIPPFYSICNLDVFSYYELHSRYDSELKKQVFKKTQEYAELLIKLQELKLKMLKTFYYHKGFNAVGGDSFLSGYTNNETTNYVVNYNLKLKAFPITIGEVLPWKCSRSFMPKVISGLEFPTLPTKKVYDLYQSKNSYREILLIPTNEEIAIEIENNRNDIEIIILFQIKSIEPRMLNDIDFQRDRNSNYGCKEPVEIVATKNCRLIIYNKTNNKIYYDKVYN